MNREMRREGGPSTPPPGGLGIGAAHRIHEEGNSHAVHLLPLTPHPTSPHPTTYPRSLPLNPPRFLLLLHLPRSFLRLDFAATLPVLFRIAVLRLVESKDSQRTADRNNSVCCFRSACLSNGAASSESPRRTFLNTAREHCCISQPKTNTSSPKYFRRLDTSSALFRS